MMDEDDDDDFGEFDGMLADTALASAMDALERDGLGFGTEEAEAAALAELDAIEQSIRQRGPAPAPAANRTSGSAVYAPSPILNRHPQSSAHYPSTSSVHTATNTSIQQQQQQQQRLFSRPSSAVATASATIRGHTNASAARPITSYFSRQQIAPTAQPIPQPRTPEDRLPLHPPTLDTTDWNLAACAHTVDPEAIKTWLYPRDVQRQVRDYQHEIIRVALFVNTLACIPTGMGKTFIATVVMYNYWRWFPESKVVFACPTKPLVSQQMRAYCSTVDTPLSDVVELTGESNPRQRAQLWQEKRVFFLTPQTMNNDLRTGLCPRDRLVCLVVDEAHRATGNAAYCEIARQLDNQQVRVLALTATPGGNADTVQAIVDNLRIGRIEIRTEDMVDMQQYTFERQKDVEVVPVGPAIAAVRAKLAECMLPFMERVRGGPGIEFYSMDPVQLAPYSVIMNCNKYRAAVGRNSSKRVINDLMVIHRLAYSMELMLQHGLRSFLTTLEPWAQAARANTADASRRELVQMRAFDECLQIARDAMTMPGTPSHPKVVRLVELIREHFTRHEQEQQALGVVGSERRDTRVMVFSEYRESVSELVDILNANRPLIRATQFIGQGSKKRKEGASGKTARGGKNKRSRKGSGRQADTGEDEEYEREEAEPASATTPVRLKGLKQKEQQEILARFEAGYFNTLVATCIGEEGLDIGDVDFIVCFDAKSSPTRMLQRIGRTGRHRVGRIVMLLTEGKEVQRYAKSHSSYRSVQRAIKDPDRIRMWPGNPRILPSDCTPMCEFRGVTGNAAAEMDRSKADSAAKISSRTARNSDHQTPYLSAVEQEEFQRRFWIQDTPATADATSSKAPYAAHLLRSNAVHRIPHSYRSRDAVRVMRFMNDQLLDSQTESGGDPYTEEMCLHLRQSDLPDPTAVSSTSRYDHRQAYAAARRPQLSQSMPSEPAVHHATVRAPSPCTVAQRPYDMPFFDTPPSHTIISPPSLPTPSAAKTAPRVISLVSSDEDEFPLDDPSLLWHALESKKPAIDASSPFDTLLLNTTRRDGHAWHRLPCHREDPVAILPEEMRLYSFTLWDMNASLTADSIEYDLDEPTARLADDLPIGAAKREAGAEAEEPALSIDSAITITSTATTPRQHATTPTPTRHPPPIDVFATAQATTSTPIRNNHPASHVVLEDDDDDFFDDNALDPSLLLAIPMPITSPHVAQSRVDDSVEASQTPIRRPRRRQQQPQQLTAHSSPHTSHIILNSSSPPASTLGEEEEDFIQPILGVLSDLTGKIYPPSTSTSTPQPQQQPRRRRLVQRTSTPVRASHAQPRQRPAVSRRHHSDLVRAQWLDAEAGVSGSEPSADEPSGDELSGEMDSFIDDDSQPAMDSPTAAVAAAADSAPSDASHMTAFYRQSLLSQSDEQFHSRRGQFSSARYSMRFERRGIPGLSAHAHCDSDIAEEEDEEGDEETLGSLGDFIVSDDVEDTMQQQQQQLLFASP